MVIKKLLGLDVAEPPYAVLRRDGAFEVREYGGYVTARVTRKGSFRRSTQRSFAPLYRYITGDNAARAGIDMTAPVLVQPEGPSGDGPPLAGEGVEGWSMAFILPENYTLEEAPAPGNEAVALRSVAAHRAAAIRFRGRFSDTRGEAQRRKLAAWLDANGLEHRGDWKLAGYDAPYTPPWLRRNEVLVTLA